MTGSLHVHGLLAYKNRWLETPEQRWIELFYRFGRASISPVEDLMAVGAYCAKYVTKQDNEYDFFGLWGVDKCDII